MATVPVLYNHDAAIDEYIAAVMLENMEGIELQSLIITNGDCLADQAMTTAWQIAQYTERDTPLSLSNARIYNAFPYSYRTDCIREGGIDVLLPFGPAPAPPYASGEDALRAALQNAVNTGRPLTLVCTCSLTTFWQVLKASPELEAGVDHLLWMGGAIHVKGNLDPTTIPPQIANPSAEWNVFSDPEASDWVLNHPGRKYRVTICPLDCTDQALITPEFKEALAKQAGKSKLSELAAQSYALVAAEPFYELWNVCTIVWLTHPEFYSAPVEMRLHVEQFGFYQGNLKPAQPSEESVPVDVILDLVDPKGFYDYVLKVLRTY